MTPVVRSETDAFALVVAALYDAAGTTRRFGERIAASAGQTQARWQLMSVVAHGDWTVPMAADRLGTSRQAVQRIANELVDDGLAVFVDNPAHRRSAFLQLTTKGASVLRAISEGAEPAHHAVVAALGGLDLAALRSALRLFAAAVRRVDETAARP